MAINKLTKRLVGAAMAASVAFTGAAAFADEPTITIRYGSNITEDMDGWVKTIERKGISAVAIADLDDAPDCAAILLHGKEQFRFTEALIKNGELGAVARRLGLGKSISSITKSDCPTEKNIELASLENS